MNRITVLVVTSLVGAMLVGCEGMGKKKESQPSDEQAMKDKMMHRSDKAMSEAGAMGKTAMATLKPSGAATTQPANNNVTGTVTFTQAAPDTLKVMIAITGLAPNSKHGFHIHEKGDMSDPALMSVGGHFNPAGHKHGGPDSPMAHAGDLGNVTADSNGAVHEERTVKGISLDEGSPNYIVGRAVIVHGKEDDMKTDPAGNAGPRVAGGVVEMAK